MVAGVINAPPGRPSPPARATPAAVRREEILIEMETTNRASEVWEVHSLPVGVIRFVGPCEYRREKCTKPAGIRIEVKNAGGMPEWDGEYCHEHAGRLVEKAKAAGVRIFDDEPARISFNRSPNHSFGGATAFGVLNDHRNHRVIFRRESAEKVRSAY